MAARPRDLVAGGVLVVGLALAALAWHPLGRWPALAVGVVAVLIAAVVYRLRPSAVPWHGEPEALGGLTDAPRERSHRD